MQTEQRRTAPISASGSNHAFCMLFGHVSVRSEIRTRVSPLACAVGSGVGACTRKRQFYGRKQSLAKLPHDSGTAVCDFRWGSGFHVHASCTSARSASELVVFASTFLFPRCVARETNSCECSRAKSQANLHPCSRWAKTTAVGVNAIHDECRKKFRIHLASAASVLVTLPRQPGASSSAW